jgi:hypothetical protein
VRGVAHLERGIGEPNAPAPAQKRVKVDHTRALVAIAQAASTARSYSCVVSETPYCSCPQPGFVGSAAERIVADGEKG